MCDIQQLSHYNLTHHVNYNKTPFHTYIGTRLQICVDEIISEFYNLDGISKYSITYIKYFFQSIVENIWTLKDFNATLIPIISILLEYMRKNVKKNNELTLLIDQYNSLLELENGG
jgi:hypothetical protein